MRIGLSTFVTDYGIRPATLGKALEERGFDALFIAEHSHIPASRLSAYPGGGDLPKPYYHAVDPFVALGAAAAVTSTLRLGTGITLLVQRDVLHTANEVATLDLISDGRVDFGVGVGWNREEMENHGTDPKTRGKLIDEQLDVLKAVWTQERAEFHGELIDFDPIFAWPKPVQDPHPPIYVGGNSIAAVKHAAGHADAWLPNGAADAHGVKAQLALRDEHLGSGGTVLPITVDASNLEVLDAYAEAGIPRIALLGTPAPEADTLRALDGYADLVARYRD
ncbi:LLM class F420-dependent oxidoreductase [Amycolatopsis minnesotensis]|uniref:LLM class F420-dependent oxidoreductase n=1 Tax=Amycolatopsis minnesotensis TaxID=337894 RepID=A0ABP5CS72_9PSEU